MGRAYKGVYVLRVVIAVLFAIIIVTISAAVHAETSLAFSSYSIILQDGQEFLQRFKDGGATDNQIEALLDDIDEEVNKVKAQNQLTDANFNAVMFDTLENVLTWRKHRTVADIMLTVFAEEIDYMLTNKKVHPEMVPLYNSVYASVFNELSQIIVRNAENEPIARLMVRDGQAGGDIDLAGMVAEVDFTENKALIYMEAWPEEVEEVKYLYIPSSGTGKVYICPEATSIEEVTYENSVKVIIALGDTVAGMTVGTVTINGKEFYVIENITGGGGELIPVQGVSLTAEQTLTAKSGSYSLMPVLTPANATDKSFYWHSNNSEIIAVDENGVVTPNKPGIAEISVTTIDGGYTSTSIIKSFAYGDVSGNWEVDISDAVVVLRHIAGLINISDEFCPTALLRAKVTQSGEELNVGDAILILRRIVGLITEFPVECNQN